MKFKANLTSDQKEIVESRLTELHTLFFSLEEEYKKKVRELEERIENYKKFWEENELPPYVEEPINGNPNKLHLTKTEWRVLGVDEFLNKKGADCCVYCGKRAYVRIFHGPYDNSEIEYFCSCSGCKKNRRFLD